MGAFSQEEIKARQEIAFGQVQWGKNILAIRQKYFAMLGRFAFSKFANRYIYVKCCLSGCKIYEIPVFTLIVNQDINNTRFI